MRLGTFVLGGLAGAAVVMLIRNRTVNAAMNGIGEMLKHRMNEMKETAIDRGMNVKFGGGLLGLQTKNAFSAARNGSASSEGLEQVEHLASKDPKVKHEINEILNQNGQHI
ncbi:hypothetical protein GE107_11425 [Cohnella sp. CFH 77786]|uniref:hypothetical protein n=1 Tax=Cohnella sp. CFH 77786 TaxID=2662265 RepID=UPI001C60DDB5|nr:hypothetical protein [Cohnella sp. CFH 77786]MBW5446671.1 hypothetical protein [Cohnella sp. CFH 77786]